MCGIFGIVYGDGRTVPDPGALSASAALLHHRGPDARGTHAEAGVGFAHTRLSLLDLSERGTQPFWDPSRRYCLVYNGEIYSYLELKSELESEGVRFLTGTDTEVLLHALIRHGVDRSLPRLAGMFAFAFWDRERRALVLARDRFGIKPLVLWQDVERLLFASEIKAFRPWVTLAPRRHALASYLLGFGGPTKERTFYEGVRIVPPGTAITIELGRSPREERFFRHEQMIDRALASELARAGDEALVDRVDAELSRSVESMLRADARVGALCSGGVDSSLVLALAARRHGDLAIFHADVVGPASEREAAELLARHLGLELRTVPVRDQDFIDLIPAVTAHYEHPFYYHPNSVPFLAVARLVHEHGVTGVLSGEGADESFLGYAPLAQEPFLAFYRRAVERVRAAVQVLPLVGRLLWPDPDRTRPLVTSMLNHFERELEDDELRAAWGRTHGDPRDPNARSLLWLSYHLRTLLHRNDCLGMAASVEARFPFLDERLVTTAVNLPHRAKIRFSPATLERAHPFVRDKWVLRKVAERYLPRGLSHRKKLGFPVSAYRRMTVADAFFEGSFVANAFELSRRELAHFLRRADRDLRLKLLLLEVWGRVCVERTAPEDVVPRLREHAGIASG